MGARPARARTNEGPVRNRNDWPARSANSTPHAAVSRSEYFVALTATHVPSAVPASKSRTRDGPPGLMSARPVLRGRRVRSSRRDQQHAVKAAAQFLPADRLQRRRLRPHVTAQRGVAAAQQLRTAPSGDSDQAARPAWRARPRPAQPDFGSTQGALAPGG